MDGNCEIERGRRAKPEVDNEQLLKMAATFNRDDVEYGRGEDGALRGWHDWAASHPQRDDPVQVCEGRKEWKSVKPEAQASTQVSVVSWNILSDTWYEAGREEEYPHTLAEHGSWEGRFPLLVEWVKALHPDVLALQEMDFCKFEEFATELRAFGYSGLMQSRKKHSATQPCGVATFWLADRLNLIKHKSFSRSMALALHLFGHEEQATTNICVVNVHLESSQSEAGADKRAKQLNSPLLWASRVASGCPLVVCGDCNTGADAALFHVLRNYKWHGHGLAAVYEHPATARTFPVCRATFAVPNHHYIIDHIVYSHEMLRLGHVLNALTEEETKRHLGSGVDKGFPSSLCPSDHIPIGATFYINRNTNDSSDRDKLEPSASLSVDREAEIRTQWQNFQDEKPLHSRGKPSPEEINERREYAKKVKAWKNGFEDALELAYVKDLVKGKRK